MSPSETRSRTLFRAGLCLGLAALVAAAAGNTWGLQAPPASAPAAPATKAAPPPPAPAPAPAAAPAPVAAKPAATEAADAAPAPVQLTPQPRMCAVSIPKLMLVLVFAAIVFYVCNWTFLDTRFVSTNRTKWGLVVLGGGLAGLTAAVLVPVIYAGLPLGVIFFGGAAVAYAVHRNTLVTPPLQVLTGAHLVRLRRRIFGRTAEERAAVDRASGAGRPIIFMGLDDLPIRVETTSPDEQMAMNEVERVLHDAIMRRASTVGYLAKPTRGEVKFRISGETCSGGDVDRPAADHFTDLVKRMANLDPAETRKPQEGRVRAIVATQPFELRIKTAGTVKGEQIAIRIIDVVSSQLRLERIGLSEGAFAALNDALAVHPGLVILSGTQDSGLTTTIHSCLRHFDRYVSNVVVFEPHTDIEVENVQHILINQEDGPVATAEVRSRMRMEPDVVAFDSLALPEIAGLLAEASKEHTVVVGIRAADAVQAIARLAALLGSSQALADRLQAVTNQRLVRLLCPDCKEAYRPNPDFLRKANLGAAKVDILYRPPTRTPGGEGASAVCPRCNNERYAGRTGLFEVMPIDAVAREMIGRGASAADVRAYIRKGGMRNLQEEGLQMVIEGRTSIEEVLRAIKQAT
jgi:type II secretory ATPase GspE/PulE/Tfp pilus assembly ATPase PilB-like protein